MAYKGQKHGFCIKGHVLVPNKQGKKYCPICFSPAVQKEKLRKWYVENPDAVRRGTLKRSGWTLEMYDLVSKAQDGVCAICKKGTEGNLSADHKHINPPQPRGLLCNNCNLILGHAKDNTAILEAAIAYLRKHGEP